MRSFRMLVLVLSAIVALAPMSIKAQSDGWQVTKLVVSAGKGLLSSGIGPTAVFENASGSRTFELSGDDSQGYGVYAWNFGSKFSIAATGGHLMNTPWVGPKVDWRPLKGVTLMTWPGVSFGRRFGEPGFTPNFGIKSGFLFVDVKSFTASFAALKFEEEKTRLVPGLAWTKAITSEYSMLAEGDYDLTNNRPLYRVQLTRTFAKK